MGPGASAPGQPAAPRIFMTTTEAVAGGAVERTLGLVRASVVRSRHIGSDIGAGLKSIVGGKLRGYEQLLATAREEVLSDLAHQAAQLGANAVICLRLQTSDIMQGATEVLAYGTAVTLKST